MLDKKVSVFFHKKKGKAERNKNDIPATPVSACWLHSFKYT